MSDYLRPWKLVTLAIGMGLLIAGALYFKQADWDVGISFIMGFLTYFTAPWGLRTIKALKWKLFPLVLLAYWFTVDGSYVLYNSWVGRTVSHELRMANLFASSMLYLLCALIWFPQRTFLGLFKSQNT